MTFLGSQERISEKSLSLPPGQRGNIKLIQSPTSVPHGFLKEIRKSLSGISWFLAHTIPQTIFLHCLYAMAMEIIDVRRKLAFPHVLSKKVVLAQDSMDSVLHPSI
jgi:hypothetical protein